MAINLPERRLSQLRVPEKRRIPIEQILQVMGNNPIGQALPGIGKQLGEALMASAQRKRQEAQIAGISKATGIDLSGITDPAIASSIAKATADNRSEEMRARESLDLRRMLAESLAQKNSQPKPPPGFRYTSDGSLEAIPGGPAAIKIGAAEEKEANLRRGAVSQADRIISKVDQALARVGPLSAGFGALSKNIPMTPAKNLASDLQTIKANLGFAELQAMRQASPTGGALGQVAVQELEALQSTLASLDQAQSPDQLSSRLNEVKTHYQNWKNAVSQASSGGEQNQAQTITSPDQEAEAYLRKFQGGQ